MKVKKAFIPLAGYGTRFFPITKAINKEMLPVLNRPLVDYVVEDCLGAGITDIFFITLKNDVQLKTYYSEHKELESYLLDRGAQEKYEQIVSIHKRANFHFIEQPQDGRYGTAIPLLLAKDHIASGEYFLILMGDDFIYNSDGSSELQRLIESTTSSGFDSGLCVTEVPREEVSKYGVASINSDGSLTHFVEKPAAGSAPSNLINISKYLFHSDAIADMEASMTPHEDSGEYYITDVFERYSKRHPMYVHSIKGKYLDGGNPAGLLKANIIVGRDHPELVGDLTLI